MENTVTLELSVQQLNVIIGGLAKLPIEVAIDTFQIVQQQAQKQLGQPTKPEGPLSDKVI
jgi:hypothetical protein